MTAIMTQKGGWRDLRKTLSKQGYYISVLQIRTAIVALCKSWRVASAHFAKYADQVSSAQWSPEILSICTFYRGVLYLDKNQWLQDLLRQPVGQMSKIPRTKTKNLDKVESRVKTASLDRIKETPQHVDKHVKTKALRYKRSSHFDSDSDREYPTPRRRKRRIIESDTDDDDHCDDHKNNKDRRNSSDKGCVKDNYSHKNSHKIDGTDIKYDNRHHGVSGDGDVVKSNRKEQALNITNNSLPAKLRRKQHLLKQTSCKTLTGI